MCPWQSVSWTRSRSGWLIAALAGAASLLPAIVDAQTIKVGVTTGPHAEIMGVVKKVAVDIGLDARIVEFGDYMRPNAGLASGELDANS